MVTAKTQRRPLTARRRSLPRVPLVDRSLGALLKALPPTQSAPEGRVLPIPQDQRTRASEPGNSPLQPGPKEWSEKTPWVSSHGRVSPTRNAYPLDLSQSGRSPHLSNASSSFSSSYRPPCDDSNHGIWLQLKDDLQPSAADTCSDQLVPIPVFRRISYSEKKHSTASSKLTPWLASLSLSKSYSKSDGWKRCQFTTLFLCLLETCLDPILRPSARSGKHLPHDSPNFNPRFAGMTEQEDRSKSSRCVDSRIHLATASWAASSIRVTTRPRVIWWQKAVYSCSSWSRSGPM